MSFLPLARTNTDSPLRALVHGVVLTLAYLVLALWSVRWATVLGAASPVFPATGLALAGLLLGGLRLWPAVFLGRLLALLFDGVDQTWLVPVVASAGNAAAAVAGAWVLRRVLGGTVDVGRLRDLLWLLLWGGLGSTLLSAGPGILALWVSGSVTGVGIPVAFMNWWSGSLTGVLLVTPLVLAWVGGPAIRLAPARVLHFLLVMACCAGVAWAICQPGYSLLLRPWALFPFLVWAALAFRVRGAATALLVSVAVCMWFTSQGQGAFAEAGLFRYVLLQQFIAVACGTVLVLAVVADERRAREAVAVADRLRHEAERMARVEAERASRLSHEFLSTVSHELRTPLNAIVGWANVLARRSADPDLVKEGAAVIGRNARIQVRLIEDLLDTSRLESGRLRLERLPVSMRKVIDDALQTVAGDLRAKSLQVERRFDDDVPPVTGDADRLQQVVWNVLANAVKFSPEGGRIEVDLAREGRTVRIRVTDQGKGIPPDFLPHVFDRFRQQEAGTTRRHGGLGLGLAIARQLVSLHGGTLTAHSEGEGRGATFTMVLPAGAAGAAPDADATPHALPEGVLAGVQVLVVDDEPDMLGLLGRVLEDAGVHVQQASGAMQALGHLRIRRPALLVSDIGMPEMDGVELVRRLRRHEALQGLPRLPAVAVSAYSRDVDRQRALEAGFDAYLVKPVDAGQLLSTLAALLGRERG